MSGKTDEIVRSLSDTGSEEETARESAERAEFEAHLAGDVSQKKFEIGQLVKGTIASIQEDGVLVAIGGKSEVTLARNEIDEGAKVGDPIEAIVMSVSPELRLSRRMAADRRSAEALRGAFEARIPVEGRVLARNKGGFNIGLGKVAAFCPASQMDIGGGQDPNSYVDKNFEFRIIEYAENGRRIVVSRAVMLKEDRERRSVETRSKLAIGAVLTGKVMSLTDYGAFVDVGGIEGLLHVSEISRRRLGHPKEVLTSGQEIQVKITKIEQDGRRISLSMKEFEKDPWSEVAGRYSAGASFSGKIVRAVEFGWFVELEPGLEGLLHVSQLPPGVAKNDPTLAVGEGIQGWIRETDVDRRRISLALREVALGDPWAGVENRYPAGSIAQGIVERNVNFGSFVSLEPGLTGLIPISEMALPPGSDPSKAFTAGQKVTVKVVSVDPVKKRISLSAEGAKAEAARGEYLEYAKQSGATESAAGLGAMAAAFAKSKDTE